jgi:hypothetical protein
VVVPGIMNLPFVNDTVWCVVRSIFFRLKSTAVSEQHIATIFRAKECGKQAASALCLKNSTLDLFPTALKITLIVA